MYTLYYNIVLDTFRRIKNITIYNLSIFYRSSFPVRNARIGYSYIILLTD